MEFHQKLQELRKQRGLTQEELAQALYVSRTAISKWESGRGYPNIESLKAISGFFSVTLDDLLSSDEILTIAEENGKQTERHICDLVFGLLDLCVALLLFLPLFAQRAEGQIYEVALLSLTEVSSYLKILYLVLVGLMTVWGVLTLALQNYHGVFWEKSKNKLSLIFNALGVLIFIMSLQPYAATLLFVFLTVKLFILIKKK